MCVRRITPKFRSPNDLRDPVTPERGGSDKYDKMGVKLQVLLRHSQRQ